MKGRVAKAVVWDPGRTRDRGDDRVCRRVGSRQLMLTPGPTGSLGCLDFVNGVSPRVGVCGLVVPTCHGVEYQQSGVRSPAELDPRSDDHESDDHESDSYDSGDHESGTPALNIHPVRAVPAMKAAVTRSGFTRSIGIARCSAD